jgi:hypothetical protein
VYNSPMVNIWLLGGQSDVDVSNIHTLDISNGPLDISKLVRKVGSSLENLKISYLFGGSYCFYHYLFSNDCTGDGLLRPIDLGQNPNIRIISLEAPDRRIIATLKSLLSHIVLTNIERINLIFYEQSETTDLPDWKEIDVILDSKRFVTLRRVMLYVLHLVDDHGVDDAWFMKLSEQLHSLNSKGIWHVHSSGSKVHHTRSQFSHADVQMYDPAP